MKDVFCKIIDGEIPSAKVYEDDDVVAFLDVSQITHGHTLVVPKTHYESVLDTPKDTLHKVYDVAQRIGQAMIEILHADGVNIITNAGEAAGQSVPHFHVHVLPRYLGGEGVVRIERKENIEAVDLPVLAESIKTGLFDK